MFNSEGKVINEITNKEIKGVSEKPIMDEKSFSNIMEIIKKLNFKQKYVDFSGLELIVSQINNFQKKVIIDVGLQKYGYNLILENKEKKIPNQITITHKPLIGNHETIMITETQIHIRHDELNVYYFFKHDCFYVTYNCDDYCYNGESLFFEINRKNDKNKDNENILYFKSYFDLMISLFALNAPIFVINSIATLGCLLQDLEPIKSTYKQTSEFKFYRKDYDGISHIDIITNKLLSEFISVNVLECTDVVNLCEFK